MDRSKDYKELVDFIGEWFKKIDQRLERIGENKADKTDVSELLTAVDGYAKKADGYFQEMLMLSHKVNRLEKWILQLAEKIGIQLTP